jgi:hypothetical protein
MRMAAGVIFAHFGQCVTPLMNKPCDHFFVLIRLQSVTAHRLKSYFSAWGTNSCRKQSQFFNFSLMQGSGVYAVSRSWIVLFRQVLERPVRTATVTRNYNYLWFWVSLLKWMKGKGYFLSILADHVDSSKNIILRIMKQGSCNYSSSKLFPAPMPKVSKFLRRVPLSIVKSLASNSTATTDRQKL